MWMCCTRSTKKAVCWKNASAGWNPHAIQAISRAWIPRCDLLQALQWEPDRVSAFWPDLCDACRTLYRLSGEQLDIYVRLTQPAYAADLHLVEPDTLPPS